MGSGPHAYAASSLPTQHLPSPASQVYSKELIGTKLANIVVNITDCLLFGFYRAQLFKAKTIFCTNNTQTCCASTDDWEVVVCKHTHIHRHTQWEEITLVGKEQLTLKKAGGEERDMKGTRRAEHRLQWTGHIQGNFGGTSHEQGWSDRCLSVVMGVESRALPVLGRDCSTEPYLHLTYVV